jgi:hypothetical protein
LFLSRSEYLDGCDDTFGFWMSEMRPTSFFDWSGFRSEAVCLPPEGSLEPEGY